MIRKLLFTAGLSLLLIACGGDGGKQTSSLFEVMSPKSCSLHDKNQFVYDVLKDSYLWSDKVGDLNISLESNETLFLDNFLYQDDRFSHILTLDTYTKQFTTGEATNFGYLSALVENDQGGYDIKIAYVFANSPADKAGLHRSDTILPSHEINSTTTLRIKNSDRIIRDIEIKKEVYNVSNISHQTIFNIEGKNVAYFVFKSFVGPNLVKNLDDTFAYFKRQNVSELILDLRYNGGGLLDVAAHLGSLIGGYNVRGHIFQNNRFNEKYSKYNSSIFFDTIPEESLYLNKVYIIATQNSASASESLINALKASDNHIEVITIGTPTYGKPFGMYTLPYCDRVLIPIHFSDENSDGNGGFVDGLIPTCKVKEDINRDFGDQNETLLKETLYYLKNGQCSQ